MCFWVRDLSGSIRRSYLNQQKMAGDQSGEFVGGGVGKGRQHFLIDPINLRLARANRLSNP